VFNLENTPYLLDGPSTQAIKRRLDDIEERIALLRREGVLNPDTLRHYYGEKRFEQVAESNALEGSTLNVGETELAVLRGTTITGHDPAYVRDAIALDKALMRITELARNGSLPTDIQQLHEIHDLLLGDRPGAGIFRKERVKISGARHVPPKTWELVMEQMEGWQHWSKQNPSLPAPIRSAVLHAWLTHIHPYIDGNGRTARAVGNLELIRSGYPPIIIKRKERDRYIESLAESDEGGDIRSFIDLVMDRLQGALLGLENSAKQKQGYNPLIAKVRVQQEKQLKIWETSVKLLASIVEHRASNFVEGVNGKCEVKIFESPLDIDDYVEVCAGNSVPRSWAFIVNVEIPGVQKLERLAYIGHRSAFMFNQLDRQGAPSLLWSKKNPAGFPRWISANESSPYALEMTTAIGNGDEWIVRLNGDSTQRMTTTSLAEKITESLVYMASEGAG
jgi:Fic family protein